ncbi:MAG: serine hydrolase [Gammaproteobacteria bacterium]|nr:serine hydrolase [Gammaproteobacteria bacterium]
MPQTSLPEGNPKDLGFDEGRLAQIGPEMQKYVDDLRVPHLVTLLARHGKLVHFESRGVLDFDSQVPAPKDTLCRMFSNTKPIAGVATLILYERGVLTPDDPVAKFLPEWSDLRVISPTEPMFPRRARRQMTIRDLITNTTGLTNLAFAPGYFRNQYRETLEKIGWVRPREGSEPQERLSNRERVRALAELPLSAHPGESFVYHAGYPVLSALLEEACGQNLEQFFGENIFQPLQMNDTAFYLKDGALPRFAAMYTPREIDGKMQLSIQDKAETSEKNVGPRTEFGGGGDSGGVLSTASDYARFGQMLLNGGELDGVRILGRKTVDMMIGNHTGDMTIPMTGPGFHWGLGVATYHGRDRFPLIRSVGTYGWGGAAGTTYFADPQESMLGVVLTQVTNHGAMPNNTYQETFQRLAYQSLV